MSFISHIVPINRDKIKLSWRKSVFSWIILAEKVLSADLNFILQYLVEQADCSRRLVQRRRLHAFRSSGLMDHCMRYHGMWIMSSLNRQNYCCPHLPIVCIVWSACPSRVLCALNMHMHCRYCQSGDFDDWGILAVPRCWFRDPNFAHCGNWELPPYWSDPAVSRPCTDVPHVKCL